MAKFLDSGGLATLRTWVLSKLQDISLTPGPPGTPGETGQQGEKGEPGPGVPAGGTAGQVLAKADASDFNTQWINPPEGGDLPAGTVTRRELFEGDDFTRDAELAPPVATCEIEFLQPLGPLDEVRFLLFLPGGAGGGAINTDLYARLTLSKKEPVAKLRLLTDIFKMGASGTSVTLATLAQSDLAIDAEWDGDTVTIIGNISGISDPVLQGIAVTTAYVLADGEIVFAEKTEVLTQEE